MSDGNSKDETGIEQLFDRRDYLQGVAGAGAITALGLPSMTGSAAAAELRDQQSRRDEATNNRVNTANTLIQGLKKYEDQPNDDPILKTVSTDDGEVERYYGAYAKALPVEEDGGIEKTVYDNFVEILENEGDYEDIELGDDRELVTPPAARHFPTDGMDSWMATMPTPPAYESDLFGAEVLELYWLENFRDITLGEYTAHSDFDEYKEDVKYQIRPNTDSDPDWINLDAPFRGVSDGALTGPYLNQFYMHEANLGNIPMDPKVKPIEHVSDHFLSTDYFRNWMLSGVHPSGGAEAGEETFESDEAEELLEIEIGDKRWINTGRDLASFVRVDPAYVPYIIPTLQLFEWGAEFDSGLPYVDSDTVLQYINYGAVGFLDLLARVTRNALNAAWYQKWLVHRRARPEIVSTSIEKDDPADKISDFVFDSNGIDMGRTGENFAHLYPAYPEGAPAHPSYPSGHSAIAGACSTVIKAFFEDTNLLDLPEFETLYVPDGEGGRKELDESDTDTLTVHGEIDKIAENIGMGRLWAGIHYPTDHIYGVRLGEQAAIATLLNELADNPSDSYEPIEDLTYTPFDPDAIDDSTLNADGTAPITIDVLEQLREDAHNTEL